MILKKIILFAMCISLSGILNATLTLAAEVQKNPLTRDEISVLQKLGGNELQSLARENFVGTSTLKDASTSLSDEQRQTLLSVTPEQLDLIIAGRMQTSDIVMLSIAAGVAYVIIMIAIYAP